MPKKVYFVSLGCPKNQVDTEVMLGETVARGHRITTDPSAADVIVVNTCGFIGDASRESVDTILEMARHRTEGACRKLIVTGCLTQRYPRELAAEIPEIDRVFGTGEPGRVAEALSERGHGAEDRVEVEEEPDYLYDAATPRIVTGSPHSVYVKIAEGCDRPCGFCIIPRLRGPQRSRSMADVTREAEALIERGAREINLVAQDVTAYGDDLGGRADLARLVRRLARLPGLRWLRLNYAYPTAVSDELIDVVAGEPTVVKYIDVPLQHIDDGVLKAMRRGHAGRRLRELVAKLRARIPGVALRTTFLVGHPGETEEAFRRLHDFVAEARFDRLGVFTFSAEEGTPSASLPGRVPARVARSRRAAIMRLQRGISRRNGLALVGRELEVMVDGVSDESEYLLEGRSAGQAPEVDGKIYLADGTARPGDLVRARVTAASDYDLAASIVEVIDPTRAPRRRSLPVVGA